MANIESPGREFAKHRELWIFLNLLWYIFHSPKGHIGHTLGSTTRMADLDILKRHILDAMVRIATDTAREGIMEEIHLRPSQVVSLIWTSERYFALELANRDIS